VQHSRYCEDLGIMWRSIELRQGYRKEPRSHDVIEQIRLGILTCVHYVDSVASACAFASLLEHEREG
jgi:hypothetical protein